MAHHVIFVPGLGDHRTYGQNIGIRLWRLFGLRPHYLALGWHEHEGFNKKLGRLNEEIDQLKEAGATVSLVGVSAGASAVLNAYAQSENISRVVCIVGKINRPERVRKRVYDKNPDFKQSMDRLENSLASLTRHKRSNILSIHPWKDQTVPVEDTRIDGARELTLPGWSHASGIFFAILLGAPFIAKFIRSQ